MIDDDVIVETDDACDLFSLGNIDAHTRGKDVDDVVHLQIRVGLDSRFGGVQIDKEHVLAELQSG